MPVIKNPCRSVSTGICGNGGPLDEYNPLFVTRQDHAPELLYVLNERPMNAQQASTELNVTEKETEKLLGDLVRIRAVEEKSGAHRVTFPIFTKEDLMLVAQATKPVEKN